MPPEKFILKKIESYEKDGPRQNIPVLKNLENLTFDAAPLESWKRERVGGVKSFLLASNDENASWVGYTPKDWVEANTSSKGRCR